MGILAWIVVGLVAGVLASLVMGGTGYGIIGDIVIGIVGARPVRPCEPMTIRSAPSSVAGSSALSASLRRLVEWAVRYSSRS